MAGGGNDGVSSQLRKPNFAAAARQVRTAGSARPQQQMWIHLCIYLPCSSTVPKGGGNRWTARRRGDQTESLGCLCTLPRPPLRGQNARLGAAATRGARSPCVERLKSGFNCLKLSTRFIFFWSFLVIFRAKPPSDSVAPMKTRLVSDVALFSRGVQIFSFVPERAPKVQKTLSASYHLQPSVLLLKIQNRIESIVLYCQNYDKSPQSG
mmetsp:Transcript_3151/g.7318  ORF Transcript_3151/g.7318 Transcript_3151/m.7318 type:complete len:209 (-) Transcript_3151:57-683(-)